MPASKEIRVTRKRTKPQKILVWFYSLGSPENVGLENGGPKKSWGWKMQDFGLENDLFLRHRLGVLLERSADSLTYRTCLNHVSDQVLSRLSATEK